MKKHTSFTVIIFIIFCLMLFLPACQPAQTPAEGPSQTIAPATAAPANTEPPQSEPAATQAAPAGTQQPTQAPPPTQTLEPIPRPTAQPMLLTAESLRKVELAGRIGGGAVAGVALSPDAAQVTVLTTTALLTYDVAAGSLLWQKAADRVYNRAVYTADGSQIVTSTRGGTVQRWDAK
ncbi:MAG: hypothetical protein AAGU05_11105, partial [Anaerolineaceae bacterium]